MEKYGIDKNLEQKENVIYLAGGCFWGLEKLVNSLPGVTNAVSGYANGHTENPTYNEVCGGNTGYRETVKVEYDPKQISLETILYAYFSVIDPTLENRQGHDIGTQYQTGVYYVDKLSEEVVLKVVEVVKHRVTKFKVEIKPLDVFYEAEEYHQHYLDKNPTGYCHISKEQFEKVKKAIVDASKYQKPSDEELTSKLTTLQYNVTQKAATEHPYTNEYDEFFEEGIYVDIVTGEPLFSSLDKYNSGCGWPAFSSTIDPNTVIEKLDESHGMIRTEVVSRVGNSHLGHKFTGDRYSSNGIRYCINSASMRFVAKENLEKEGYGEFTKLFK